jgi:hypothetical protein
MQELNYILPQYVYVILLSAPMFPYCWHRVVKQADNQVPDYEPYTRITFVAGEGEWRYWQNTVVKENRESSITLSRRNVRIRWEKRKLWGITKTTKSTKRVCHEVLQVTCNIHHTDKMSSPSSIMMDTNIPYLKLQGLQFELTVTV